MRLPWVLAVVGLVLTSLTPPAADAPSDRSSPLGVAVAAGVAAGADERDVFVVPVPGAPVLTPFRAPAHRYGAGHRGVDLGGGPGVAVLAAGDGVVAFAGTVAGRPVVSVQHPSGLRTTYEPVLASVTAGVNVRAGDLLGTLQDGHPGCATSCLHWGARLPDGDYLDPMSLLGPRRVRLYPWVDP